MTQALKKGQFLCSIDTELAWGSAHRDIDPTTYQHWNAYGRVRDTVERLLELMDRYDIRATWAFVGRLLLDPRDQDDISRYPVNPQPAQKYITGSRTEDPEFLDKWCAPELLDMVMGANVNHEIGSHSFSHIIADTPGYSKASLVEDLKSANEQAMRLGLQLRTLIYPQNKVAHTNILGEMGFTAYRSVPDDRISRLPSVLRGIVLRANAYLPIPVGVTYPEKDGDTWNLPASYYYRHSGGWARWQSNLVRRVKMKSGLRRAANNRGLFHIWFHPYDIASDPNRLLKPLEATFKEVAALRAKGVLDNMTLGETAELLSNADSETPYEVNKITHDARTGQVTT